MNYSQGYQTSGCSSYLYTPDYSNLPVQQSNYTFSTSGSFNWSPALPSNTQMLWKLIFIRNYCKNTDHYNCNLKDNNKLTKI